MPDFIITYACSADNPNCLHHMRIIAEDLSEAVLKWKMLALKAKLPNQFQLSPAALFQEPNAVPKTSDTLISSADPVFQVHLKTFHNPHMEDGRLIGVEQRAATKEDALIIVKMRYPQCEIVGVKMLGSPSIGMLGDTDLSTKGADGLPKKIIKA